MRCFVVSIFTYYTEPYSLSYYGNPKQDCRFYIYETAKIY